MKRLLILTLLLTSLPAYAEVIDLSFDKSIRVVGFGCSIEQGNTPTEGYYQQTRDAFGVGFNLNNLAIGGTSMRIGYNGAYVYNAGNSQMEIIRNWHNGGKCRNYDIAIWTTDYNGCRHDGLNNESINGFTADLNEALGIFNACGVHLFLGTLPKMLPASYSVGAPTWNHCSDEVGAVYAGLLINAAAAYPNVTVVDFHSLFDATNAGYYTDGIHPNTTGIAVLRAILYAIMTRGWSN